MTSLWQPGQLLFAGFDGTEVPIELAETIAKGRVGGVVLFSRNIRNPLQLRALIKELHDLAPPTAPLLVAIDQEGGRVQRLRSPWSEWPPAGILGEANDLELTRAVARAVATELFELGIDLDFAPVVDVASNAKSPIIGDRSFSSDPKRVSRHASTWIQAMQDASVAGCAKHFPGHGDSESDSHLELPRFEHDLARLREIELPPFRAAIDADVASIMTAHILYTQLDDKRPATLSPEVMHLLRHDLGYDKLVFSDDLEMRALSDHFRPKERVVGCLRAGVDSMLICSRWDLFCECLSIVEKSRDALVEHALRRMVEFKQRWCKFPANEILDVTTAATMGEWDDDWKGPPYEEHQDLIEQIKRITGWQFIKDKKSS